jgi:U32 family peptidase
VLARECSIKEIEKIQTASSKFQVSSVQPESSENLKLPLEVFVHGALCVAYSGQCLTSEALGGRSANRGECAQACRMPYELISDGEKIPLGDKKYLLSPQDLAGLEVLPELVRAGVASLKIEGRLKTPEYVANITRVYRNALDRIFHHQDTKAPGKETENSFESGSPSGSSSSQYEMEMAFSRGLYSGWFRGNNNQQLVHARFGKKRGVYLGEVSRVENEQVFLRLEAPLKPGDGIVFDASHPEQQEEGGRVYEVKILNSAGKGPDQAALSFGDGDIDFSRVHVGDKLWKTDDPELNRRLRQTFASDKPNFQRPISFEVHGLAGTPLTIIARDDSGNIVQSNSAMPLAKAEKQPLTSERLREQLGRLGGTPFKLGELKNFLEGDVLLPVSELNRMRREVVAEVERLRAQPKRWTWEKVDRRDAETLSKESSRSTSLGACDCPELIVLVRNLAQLEITLKSGVETVYCEFENPKKYRDAVALVRAQAANRNCEIFVAPPRIFKTGEEWILNQVRSCDADGYLVRNYDHLNFFENDRRVGDFSLNVANSLSADYFKNKFGLERVTTSYDLNFQQLDSLLNGAPPEWFEVTIHQHIPMFHMEHCVFCAFLSSGTDYTNCGRPCDKHEVKLRDRVGAEHPLKADLGCRNTVFNSMAQTGAEYVERMMRLGVKFFRIEFLNETPEQVTQTISKYRQLLRKEISGAKLWRELKLLNRLGVTRGQLEN